MTFLTAVGKLLSAAWRKGLISPDPCGGEVQFIWKRRRITGRGNRHSLATGIHMTQVCEACETSPSDTVEPCDDKAAPYHLCSACHTRLHALALRPVEWYNLAKRHGWWQFLLHDDFYDEDGTALQPECELDSPELHRSPTFDDVLDNPEALLDFTITRWHIEEPVVNAWRNHSPDHVLRVVTRRFADTQSAGIKSVILDVASTLGRQGEEFVRYAWGDYPETIDLPSIAKATADCLPYREGYDCVVGALSHREESEKRDLMLSLSYFHSQETLDWIEVNIFSPITETWGRLAAASNFDWPRATKWLDSGRPLSLVALDALAAIIRPQSPLLREYSPRFQQPPDFETLTNVLSSHAERDSVPRVSRITKYILEHAAVLTKAD